MTAVTSCELFLVELRLLFCFSGGSGRYDHPSKDAPFSAKAPGNSPFRVPGHFRVDFRVMVIMCLSVFLYIYIQNIHVLFGFARHMSSWLWCPMFIFPQRVSFANLWRYEVSLKGASLAEEDSLSAYIS